jgi:hypothetical protein
VTPWTVLHTRWGEAVLVDQEDANLLAPLLAAGAALKVRLTKLGDLQAVLAETLPDGKRITLDLAKVLLKAGPRDQPVKRSPVPLDYRKAQWVLERREGLCAWNSHLVGASAVRGPGKPA